MKSKRSTIWTVITNKSSITKIQKIALWTKPIVESKNGSFNIFKDLFNDITQHRNNGKNIFPTYKCTRFFLYIYIFYSSPLSGRSISMRYNLYPIWIFLIQNKALAEPVIVSSLAKLSATRNCRLIDVIVQIVQTETSLFIAISFWVKRVLDGLSSFLLIQGRRRLLKSLKWATLNNLFSTTLET